MTQAPPPPHEAVERLEAAVLNVTTLADAFDLWGAHGGKLITEDKAKPMAADLRTVLSHLRQVEEREAVMREALERAAGHLMTCAAVFRDLRRQKREEANVRFGLVEEWASRARSTALTHSPSTPGTENAGE